MQPARGNAARIDIDDYLKEGTRPEIALARAFRALLSMSGPGVLDLCDRRIEIAAPLDLSIHGRGNVSRAKHSVRNGTIVAVRGAGWTETTLIRSARHDPPGDPVRLSGLDTDGIEIGASLGKEGEGIFVRAVDRRAGHVDLALPLRAVQPRQIHTFRRARYAIDLSGLGRVENLTFQGITLELGGLASGILLAPEGGEISLRDCTISDPRRHAIASPGAGCRGLRIERCLIEAPSDIAPVRRRASGIVANGDAVLVRDSVIAGFATALTLAGAGHMIAGNEVVQSHLRTSATPSPAIVLTEGHAATQIRGNRFANGFVLLTDRHRGEIDVIPAPGIGGVTIEGNIFEAWAATATTAFLVVKPCGPGTTICDLEVGGNTFRSLGGTMRRVERVDESEGGVDPAAATAVHFAGNIHCGILRKTRNPVTLRFDQPEASRCWILDPSDELAFGSCLRGVVAILPEWPLLDSSGREVGTVVPQVRTMAGRDARRMELRWAQPVSGRATVTLRCDGPG